MVKFLPIRQIHCVAAIGPDHLDLSCCVDSKSKVIDTWYGTSISLSDYSIVANRPTKAQ